MRMEDGVENWEMRVQAKYNKRQGVNCYELRNVRSRTR